MKRSFPPPPNCNLASGSGAALGAGVESSRVEDSPCSVSGRFASTPRWCYPVELKFMLLKRRGTKHVVVLLGLGGMAWAVLMPGSVSSPLVEVIYIYTYTLLLALAGFQNRRRRMGYLRVVNVGINFGIAASSL